MKLAKLAARSAAIVIACISAAIAAPFQNGSFEIGTDPGGSFLTLPNGDSTDITGWTVIGGDIDYIGGYWQAAQGSRSLDLIGDQFVGGIQQTFDTIPGATYSVSFEMAGNPDGGPTIRPLAVTVAGTTNNFTFDITGATRTNMNWTTHQFTFVATGSAETIQFVSDLTGDPAGCCYGAALDNVQIVGLPDLTIVKSHSGNFTQGQTGATYTIAVTNTGAGPTSGTVSVIDSLPSGLIATAIGGGGWNCVLGTLTCTRSDSLDPGLSYPDITLTVTAATDAPALVTNTATVSGGGDINPGNNSASDPTIIVQVAGLALSKTPHRQLHSGPDRRHVHADGDQHGCGSDRGRRYRHRHAAGWLDRDRIQRQRLVMLGGAAKLYAQRCARRGRKLSVDHADRERGRECAVGGDEYGPCDGRRRPAGAEQHRERRNADRTGADRFTPRFRRCRTRCSRCCRCASCRLRLCGYATAARRRDTELTRRMPTAAVITCTPACASSDAVRCSVLSASVCVRHMHDQPLRGGARSSAMYTTSGNGFA